MRGLVGGGREKLFLAVRYVLYYEEFYRRGLGGQAGSGTHNPFLVLQYPQRS